MLCQNCGRNEATTHIKRVINGETTEAHLCAECVSSLGYGDVFSGFGFNLGDIFGSLLGEAQLPQLGASGSSRCSGCGSSWQDIVRSGKVGCAECYRTFFDRLLPSLQRIHGSSRHSGKVSANSVKHVDVDAKVASEEETSEQKIKRLKNELDAAVQEQNFELAAQLRDEIRGMQA